MVCRLSLEDYRLPVHYKMLCYTLCTHPVTPGIRVLQEGHTGTVLRAQHRDWCVRGSSRRLLNEWTSSHRKCKTTLTRYFLLSTSALNMAASAGIPWAYRMPNYMLCEAWLCCLLSQETVGKYFTYQSLGLLVALCHVVGPRLELMHVKVLRALVSI